MLLRCYDEKTFHWKITLIKLMDREVVSSLDDRNSQPKTLNGFSIYLFLFRFVLVWKSKCYTVKSSVITSLSEVTVIEDLNCFEKKTFAIGAHCC